MNKAIDKSNNKVNIFNLGTDEHITVNDSIKIISNQLDLEPVIKYSGEDRGWIGDNKFIYLDCSKIRSLGLHPKYTIEQSIIKTVEYLNHNKWILKSA